jgi:hypothetical protein
MNRRRLLFGLAGVPFSAHLPELLERLNTPRALASAPVGVSRTVITDECITIYAADGTIRMRLGRW